MCSKRIKPLGVIQNMKLLSLGKATSRTPNCVGSKKLPKAPYSKGTITKKTITKAWTAATVKYFSELLLKKLIPAWANSIRITVASIKPEKEVTTINIKYIIAILL